MELEDKQVFNVLSYVQNIFLDVAFYPDKVT